MTESSPFRFLHVVRRNYLVWRKLLIPSLLGNFADPLIWMLGFGIGFGALLPQIDGVPYLTFLGSGMICYTAMYSASFESLYSAFARLQTQRTWEGILYAPMLIRDVVLGEWTWAALKGVISGAAILVVMYGLGLIHGLKPLAVLPVVALTGFAFAGIGLIMTAVAKSYDFFVYYFTLVITPMMLLSGVFFPASGLPAAARQIAALLPLQHSTELTRGIVLGVLPQHPLLNVLVLVAYGVTGVLVAAALLRRRLMK